MTVKKTLRDKRNKVIIGLLIYQGVTPCELLRMEPGHVQLNKGSKILKSPLLHMFRSIHQGHPEVKNAMQIRSSVITHWLKHYNLRQVQYMAGHKYVSSTERYQQNNLDKLQSKLEKYHPLSTE